MTILKTARQINLLNILGFFLLLCVFAGCEKDLYESQEDRSNKLKLRNLPLEEFKAIPNLYDGILKVNQRQKNKLSRGVYDSVNDFEIHTEKMVIAELNGRTWITLPVTREYETGKIENLVLKSDDDGKYIPLLVTYTFSQQDITDLKEGRQIESYQDKTSHRTLAAIDFSDIVFSTKFVQCYTIIIASCSYGNHFGGMDDGHMCPGYTETEMFLGCDDGGGGGPGDGASTGQNPAPANPSPSHPNGGPGGTNNTNTGNQNTTGGVYGNGGIGGTGIVTSPIIPRKTVKDFRLEFEQILLLPENSEQELWWENATNAQKDEIAQYLYSAGTPEFDPDNVNIANEHQVFILDVILRMQQEPELFTNIKPFLIEKNIDDSDLDPCGKDVFEQIKNTANSDFAKVLAKLGADDSVYNVTIKTQLLPDGNTNPATTVPASPYKYTIYISPDYNDKTKLYIATLLLHELVHAYFFSIRDDYNTSGNTDVLSDFNLLFNLYVNKKYPLSQAPSIHHNQMAIDYVSVISSALQEYHPGLAQQIYDDLAWAGLIETTTFDTFYPEGSIERARIINRVSAEQSGHPIAAGTPNEQINYGQPCN